MKLTTKFKIKEIKNIVDFLDKNHVGRLATIDEQGFPQIIPMNFVYITEKKNNNIDFDINYSNSSQQQQQKEIRKIINSNKATEIVDSNNNLKQDHILEKKENVDLIHSIYMHTHHHGEKINNIKRNPKVGFEVDKEICFLPSYYFHPTDASFADTLYISTVIKGNAHFVTDNKEKTYAMNKMMQKYQMEGRYEKLTENMKSIQHLTVIKIDIKSIEGKYKIGQQWPLNYRIDIAKKIIQREGIKKATEILKEMKISILPTGEIYSRDVISL